MITLRFDGLFRGLVETDSPKFIEGELRRAGILCYGWVITRNGRVIAQGHGAFARARGATSNVAEYLALIEGLDALADMDVQSEAVEVIGDARSIIEQMKGSASVSAQGIYPLYARASRLAHRFKKLHWSWKPRKYNKAADLLSRRAIQQVRSSTSSYEEALDRLGVSLKGKDGTRLVPLLDLRIYQARGLVIA